MGKGRLWEFSGTKIGGFIPLLSGHSRLRAEAENQVCKRASVSAQAKVNLISTGQTLVWRNIWEQTLAVEAG